MELLDVRTPLTRPAPGPTTQAGCCPSLALGCPHPHGGARWLGVRLPKRQSRSEQGFSADHLEMRIWVLMTLLAGVVRCWHQSDWFRVLTSRQRNAAGATRCDYHLNQAAHEALISGYFHCVSATLFMPLSSWGILNPLRDGGAIPPCCCLQGQPSEVMGWRPQGNL